MSLSKEQQVWNAAQAGDLSVVKKLATDSTLNINWQGAGGFTALNYACSEGRLSVVQFLLTLSMIDVNKPSNFGFTPFLVACFNGSKEMVSLFLADKRTDVNKPVNVQCTPLWFASSDGHLTIVQLMLVSGRDIDIQIKSEAGSEPWNSKTAAEVARWVSTLQRLDEESEDEFNLKIQNCPLIADLIDSFEADPATTRQQLRELPHLRDPFIGEVFALVVFLCDGLLATTKPSAAGASEVARFFQIAIQLPMELQMVLCNRMFGSGKDYVLTRHSEPAFKKLARLLIVDQQSGVN